MSRKLPEELVPALARTGRHWPQADEDGLRKAAALWREFAAEAEGAARRCGESVRRVTADNSGHAVEAFAAYWQAFSGGGKGHLDDAHTAVGLVATAFDTAARAVDGCKAEITTTLRQLAAELKQAEEAAATAEAKRETEGGAKAEAAPVATASATGNGVVVGGAVVGGEKGLGGFAGLAGKVRTAATAQVAGAVEAVAVEAAGLKIDGLLTELGRAMKDAMATALKDPAAVHLLRLGPDTGHGHGHGTRVTAASYRGGGVDPLGTGLVLLTGEDGRQVVGVPGLSVELDEHGQPVLGADGRPVILRADGTPVADAAGLQVLTGPDGKPVVGAQAVDRADDERGRPPGSPLAVASAVVAEAAPAAARDVAGEVAGEVAGDVADSAPAAPAAVRGGHRAVTAAADWSPPPARDDGPAWGDGHQRTPAAPAAPAHPSGGSAGWPDGDYPLAAPASGGGGTPVTVRTDSVAAPPAAPPAPAPAAGPWVGPAPEAPAAVRQVGMPAPFGTPVAGGYPVPGVVPPVGPGPLAGAGPAPAVPPGAAPFGSGIGAGPPTVRTPAAGAVPPQVLPPIIGTTPVVGRPEPHHLDGRRREGTGPATDQSPLWGVVPVTTAHATALRLALRARHGAAPDELAARPRAIADSRPYGLPGGLAPVDPQHQAELERRVPRDENGLPVPHPDPAAAGDWAEAVNAGGYREPGRANNSLEIALSAVDTYAGRPTCAAPRIPTEGDAGERGGRDRAERELGAPFQDLGDGDQAFDRLTGELRRAGHGSQALLLTLDAFGRPHAWNAVNHQDTVTYLDHQLARRAPTPLHPATHGLWAITLTPEGHPLALTPPR
ncbi:toxin glutamine deamidase domain-containing protein [Streptomyces sp. Y1]|uniref:Toxin glutamine deamidase domain-containing protein n=1 Tax=Streptomyces sp. Y1 TaxID=3238634 RepID=A0AB39TMM9_9ACTN